MARIHTVRQAVDVEDRPRPEVDLRAVAEVVASPHELQELRAVPEDDLPGLFQRWWTRKEAVVKARGAGFLEDPTGLDVGWGTCARPPAPWVVHDLGTLDLPDRPALCLVTAGPAWVRVRRSSSPGRS